MFIFIIPALLLYGCGKGSGTSVYDINTGHSSSWADPAFIGTDRFHGSHVRITDGTPKGATLYLRRCSGCHGNNGSGRIGPNIQMRTASQIESCISSVMYMRWLRVLSSEDVQAIADYLADPQGNPVITPTVVNAGSCMECHGSDLKGGISKKGCYACHNGPDGIVGHPDGWLSDKDNHVSFHGTYAKEFAFSCAACHGPDLTGPAVPSCYNCHNGSEWNHF